MTLQASISETAPSDWTTASIEWKATGRRNYRPLLSDVAVRFSVYVPTEFDTTRHRLRVELPLSRIDPETVRTLVFVDGSDTTLLPAGAIPYETEWTPGEWTTVSVNLSEYVHVALPEESLDHTLRGVIVELAGGPGETVEAVFGGLSVTSKHAGDDLLARQLEWLEAASSTVTNFVGQEVSYDTTDTLHFNAYGSDVPWMDYGRLDLKTQADQIVDDIHTHGGIAAFNHPFGVLLGLGVYNNPDSLVQSTCEWLDREDVYGADMIEIGYPERELPFQAHLDLWDCISQRGQVATAIGTSDQPVTQFWDQYVNNFITWAISADTAEANLLNALAGGRAFSGTRPSRIHSARLWISDFREKEPWGRSLPSYLGRRSCSKPILMG